MRDTEQTSTPGELTAGHVFATTHWSVVLAAGRSNTTSAPAALEALCGIYWQPLYAYLRRRGFPPADAQDLTQEFFARFLERGWVGSADASKGKFRTFLLTALNRFLANEWDRSKALKRGGDRVFCTLDTEAAERISQTASQASPDAVYDRQWAMTLLDRALTRVRQEQEELGKAAQFSALSPHLAGERGAIPYAELGRALDCTEETARQAVHRLRKRFREVFREEIANTVDDPKEIEGEIRHLLAAITA